MTRATRRASAPANNLAAVYVRISDDREGEELGVTRQEEDGRSLAAAHGLNVFRVYSDNDTGASTRSAKPRPGYGALLADARAGRIGTIIAYSSSRLTRRPMELEGQIALAEQCGTRFVYVKSPSFDLNTADGRQVARMLAAADAAEAERIGERVARASRQRAERGGNHGGRRAFGFRPDGVTVDEAEAAEIRKAADQLLAGVSLRSIAADLTSRGVPTVVGDRWRGENIREVLRKPRCAGITVHDGVEVGRLAGEPILEESVWRAVVAKLDAPERRSIGRPQSWLLSGIATCACGSPVDAGPRQSYRCRSLRAGAGGGGHIRRSAPAVDAYVWRVVLLRFSKPDAIDLFARPTAPGIDVAALRQQERALLDTRKRLAAMAGAGEMDVDEWTIARQANAEKLAAVRDQLAAVPEHSPADVFLGVDDVQAVADNLSLGQRRAIIDALFQVRILPATRRGRGFDPDAVEITRRTPTA